MRMISIETKGNLRKIDVRELIEQGLHPRGEILQAVDESPAGTVFKIHLPHPAPPLKSSLEGLGLHVLVKQLEPRHFVMITAKL